MFVCSFSIVNSKIWWIVYVWYSHISDGMLKYLWYVDIYLFLCYNYICCKKNVMNVYVIGIHYEYKCHWYDGIGNIMKHIIWYREDGYVWLIVISGGMSKILWYVEFYFILLLVCRILFYSSATFIFDVNIPMIFLISITYHCYIEIILLYWYGIYI